MPVFHISNDTLKQLNVLPLGKERVLQKLIEKNLFEVLEMDFLESEYFTTSGRKIDTLAIDANGAPVIIEYKRNRNDTVISQALSYLDWLKSQKVEFFEMLVSKKLGSEKASKIDWKNPRVICIAESYNPYDILALNQISANLELLRYNYYENDIFTLENVKGEVEKNKNLAPVTIDEQTNSLDKKPIDVDLEVHLNKGRPFIRDLFFIIKERIFQLDESIQEKINNNYIAFKVSKIFAEVHIQKSKLLIYLRPKIDYNDPDKRLTKVPDSFNWVLNHRIYIADKSDVDYVMNLIEQSYKDVL